MYTRQRLESLSTAVSELIKSCAFRMSSVTLASSLSLHAGEGGGGGGRGGRRGRGRRGKGREEEWKGEWRVLIREGEGSGKKGKRMEEKVNVDRRRKYWCPSGGDEVMAVRAGLILHSYTVAGTYVRTNDCMHTSPHSPRTPNLAT